MKMVEKEKKKARNLLQIMHNKMYKSIIFQTKAVAIQKKM